MRFLLDPKALLTFARQTVSAPRPMARFLMGVGLSRSVLLQFYLLLTVLAGMVKIAFFALMPLPPEVELPASLAYGYTVFEAVVGLIVAYGAYAIGRAFGGTGSFDQSLTLVIWAQFILFLVSLLQLVVLVFLPPVTDVITVMALVLFFWLMVNFVTELHGFTSPALVFVGFILSLMALAFVLSLLLPVLGMALV